MGTHSIADAKDNLPELIDRAMAGEGVVITRDGKPVAELRGLAAAPATDMPRPVTAAEIEWLRERLVEGTPKEDAATLIRRMRDEDWA